MDGAIYRRNKLFIWPSHQVQDTSTHMQAWPEQPTQSETGTNNQQATVNTDEQHIQDGSESGMITPSPPPEPVASREPRPQRAHRPPVWMEDYEGV
jgi:hypothetical protein